MINLSNFLAFPFINIVKSDTSANATFLGWIVASFSVGQLIASPVIGYIANRTDKNKPILIVSTALIAVSNIMYAYVESFTTSAISNKWWIMLARFIMGVGAGKLLKFSSSFSSQFLSTFDQS